MTTHLRFAPSVPGREEEELRGQVREFLATSLPPGSYRPGLGMNADFAPEFSAQLAARGWIGMAVPKRYGGRDRSAVERFIVVEELLAAGAPVAAHWVADRQTAPALLAFGTEEQRQRFLPGICAGQCFFAIGQSEPDSGSDLASVRTSATRTDGGWRLNGTKIWTSQAHRSHWFAVLCRTSPLAGDRHEGLSQLLVDLASPGVSVHPISFLDGSHHFNEVVLEDVFVPDDLVLGDLGQGWKQVTSELSFERAGPDRFLSSYQLLQQFVAEHKADDCSHGDLEAVGRLVARFWTIRQLSLSVSRSIDAGQALAVQAAAVKDLGTTFEQDVVSTFVRMADHDLDLQSSSLFESLLAQSVLISPSYTIRGGTTEVLRTMVAKALRGAS